MHYAIMKIEEGRVAKYQPCVSAEEAIAHIEKYRDKYPDAFPVETDAKIDQLRFDDKKSLSIAPAPIREPVIDEMDVIREAIGVDALEAARKRIEARNDL